MTTETFKLQINAKSNTVTSIEDVALYLYVFSLNFESTGIFNTGGNFSLAKASGLIYLGVILLKSKKYLLLTRSVLYYLSPACILYILITLTSLFYASALRIELFNITLALNIIIFYIIINHGLHNINALNRGVLFFAFGALLISVLGLLGINFDIDNDGRLSVLDANANEQAIKSCTAFFIFLSLYLNKSSNKKLLRLILPVFLPLLLAFIIDTGSRSALVSLMLGVMFLIPLYKGKSILFKAVVNLIVIGLVVYAFYLIQSSDMFLRRLDTDLRGDTSLFQFGGRLIIWQSYLPLIQEYGVFGLGKTGFQYEANKIFGAAFSPHNVLLEVMLYAGIIGLLSYVLILYKVFNAAWRSYRLTKNQLPILILTPLIVMIAANQMLDVKLGWYIMSIVISNHLSQRYKMIKGCKVIIR